jgi:hypothetical protein
VAVVDRSQHRPCDELFAWVLYAFDFQQRPLALEWLCLWVQLVLVVGDALICLKREKY